MGERKAVVVMCSCGGWVLLGALGVVPAADRDTWAEAGQMGAEGYMVRGPVPLAEARAIPPCERNGDCIHGPRTGEDAMEYAGQLNVLAPTTEAP